MSTFDEHHLDVPLSPHKQSMSDSDSSDDADRHEGMNQQIHDSTSSSDSDSGIGQSSQKLDVGHGHNDMGHHEDRHEDVQRSTLEEHDITRNTVQLELQNQAGGKGTSAFGQNIFITLFFTGLFLVTFGLFATLYFACWSKLLVLDDTFADYLFVIFTWLGFVIGGATSYTFFKSVSGLKIRGLFIVALLVPLALYSDYISWSVNNNEEDNNWATFFADGGSIIASVVGGAAMGILFSFQGVFIGVFCSPDMIGFQNGLFWAIIPLTYLWIHGLDKWTQITLGIDANGCQKNNFEGLIQIFLIAVAVAWMLLPNPPNDNKQLCPVHGLLPSNFNNNFIIDDGDDVDLKLQGQKDLHETKALLTNEQCLFPFFFVAGGYFFQFMLWMVSVAYMDKIEFKTYWIIGWSCAGGLVYGVLFDKLKSDVAGFKPKLFVGLLVLAVTAFGSLLTIFQTFIDFRGDWWSYVQSPILYAGIVGLQSVIQSIITHKLPEQLNQINGAFRTAFGFGVLTFALLLQFWNKKILEDEDSAKWYLRVVALLLILSSAAAGFMYKKSMH